MKSKVIQAVSDSLKPFDAWIEDVYIEEENSHKFLRVVIDHKETLNAEQIYEIAKVIDPLIEDLDLIKEEYILDIYAKEKGDNNGQ